MFFLTLLISLQEGDIYPSRNLRIGKIEINGEVYFRDTIDVIIKDFHTKKFSPSVVDSLLLKVSNIYAERGFPFVKLTPFYSISDSNVEINIRIKAGKIFYLGEFRFSGKGRTGIFESYTKKLRGKIFRQSSIQEVFRAIERAGYFSVDSFRLFVRDDTVDIDIFTQRRYQSFILFGGGYNVDHGYSLLLKGSFVNPFGYGIKFSMNVDKQEDNYGIFSGGVEIPFSLTSNNEIGLKYTVRTFSDTMLIQSYSLEYIFQKVIPIMDFRVGLRRNNEITSVYKHSTNLMLFSHFKFIKFGIVYIPGEGRVFSGELSPEEHSINPFVRVLFSSPDTIRLEENFLSPVRGYYPFYIANLKVIGVNLYFYTSSLAKGFIFFDYSFVPEARSAGIGFKTERYSLLLAFPGFDFRRIMLGFSMGTPK